MTRPSLAGIEKRAAAATAGPWRAADEHGDLPGTDPAWCVSRMTEDGRWMHDVADEFGLEPADAAFIADARTAVPALTAAVRDVLALHQEDGHGECSHCPDPSDAHWSAPYPCPTVRALATHLDLTDPEGDPT